MAFLGEQPIYSFITEDEGSVTGRCSHAIGSSSQTRKSRLTELFSMNEWNHTWKQQLYTMIHSLS
jgi:uncharacterized protein YjlB